MNGGFTLVEKLDLVILLLFRVFSSKSTVVVTIVPALSETVHVPGVQLDLPLVNIHICITTIPHRLVAALPFDSLLQARCQF